MTAPIAPDERAAVAEYLWQFDRLRDTGGLIHSVHTDPDSDGADLMAGDLRRLLDALDTAEASLRSCSDLIARLQQGKRFADADVERLRRERDEARSAAIIAAPARPAPVWDEDTVTEAVAQAMFPHFFTDDRQPLRVFTETRSDAELWEAERESARRKARQALAVVREHAPVSGESRATVQAEALRDAADAVTEIDGRRDDAAARWLRARADRLDPKEK